MKKYTVEIKPRATKEFERLSSQMQQRIVNALEKLEDGLFGDTKHLTNFSPEYRSRVGNYRILFEIEESRVVVYRICPRKNAYRRKG